MSNHLVKETMAELCELVTDGTHDSPKLQSQGIPFIKGKHISSGTIDFQNCDFITEEDHHEACRRVKPRYGDILFSNIGSVGDTAMVRSTAEFSIKNVALFRANTNKIDPGYLYYLVLSPGFKSNILSVRSGSAQPFISLANLRSFLVDYHKDVFIQKRIAVILSAYDDLIENNLRRIKILEEMAQNLYREWFVKFRFPGHEKFRMVDSPLGKIPDGWEVCSFTDLADVLSGGTPKTKNPEFWNGGIPFFVPKDAQDSFYVMETEKSITELGLSKCNSRLYPKDTVFITARGTVGKVVLSSTEMAMNQSCYALKGRNGVTQLFLFLATKQNVEYLKKNTGGATFETIVVDTFKRMQILKPRDEIVATFTKLIEPSFQLILNLCKRNKVLRFARDLLLPRLISGELDVSELDIVVPEEVA